ncbi:MAG: hypothetical protein COB29_01090 [Sulfitobacter sp.]|nr:MAG: hypothetical protein COB29_01090 [Sulfitobacter sp.]
MRLTLPVDWRVVATTAAIVGLVMAWTGLAATLTAVVVFLTETTAAWRCERVLLVLADWVTLASDGDGKSGSKVETADLELGTARFGSRHGRRFTFAEAREEDMVVDGKNSWCSEGGN